ncbi:MAG TPA: glycosyltransferase family A protein [Chlamydiales bacterium]|nr:glycosyltransferase family A protein [Chlamydiales bacterium]
MKRLVLFLFLIGAVFAGSFIAGRWFDKVTETRPESPLPTENRPTNFTLKNLPFTIVIVGVNNGAAVEKTLTSVFSQNYENYHVVYIDDASDDGSYDVARDLIYDSGHLGQVTLARNEERLGILANLFRAVQLLDEREIILVLQGEDWLAHEWVLQRLNAYYADPDVWLTYGQYRDYPTYQLGTCRELKEVALRSGPFAPSHLNTFYAGLFKKVRESDFIAGGKFLSACSEMAYMVPMLEMAKNHAQFISEILYINNRQASYKEDRETQMRCEKFIRALDAYPPLLSLNEVEPCGA